MNQRRDYRFAVDEPVIVTILGEQDIRQTGTVSDASGRGLGLVMECPVPSGTALKIHIDDSILLGEVMYCRSTDRGYFIGVQLFEMLSGLREIGRMSNDFVAQLQEGTRGGHHR
jgi:hypothetical protein